MITEKEEYEIRKYLAINHQDGKCHIYGDDGELQCGNMLRHGRTIDFKRESISDILNVIYLTRMKENGVIESELTPAQCEKGLKVV